MVKGTIVVTAQLEKIAVDILKPFGEIVTTDRNTEEAILPVIGDAIGLIVRGSGVVSESIIRKAEKLKVIGRPGAGYDNVDIAAATAHKIPVVYAPGVNAQAVAEGAMAMILALCKNIFYWDKQLKQGNWNSRFANQCGDMEGSTVGIIGFGRIGRMLAKFVKPYNVTILAYDPYAPAEAAGELDAELVGLEELFSRSDFISIHAALTKETRAMVNADMLAKVKPGAFLINMARGGLVESLDVLYEAMTRGNLAGVGLDVFEPEPPDVNHPIFKHPNCLTAPHSLAMSVGATAKIFKVMSEGMAAVFRGERPEFVVNPEALD